MPAIGGNTGGVETLLKESKETERPPSIQGPQCVLYTYVRWMRDQVEEGITKDARRELDHTSIAARTMSVTGKQL